MKNMEKQKNIRYLTLTGLMAGLITLCTAYFIHIPVGLNGGYVHVGDALIYIAAAILPTPYAILAGAIGGSLADLLTAPMWTVATVIIKSLIVLPFTSHGKKILGKRNFVAPIIAFFISATGYYIADGVLFGEFTAIVSSFSSSLVQSGGSAIVFYVLGAALDRAGVKSLIATAGIGGLAKKEGHAHG